MVDASIDVYLARGLLDDYVKSICVAIKHQSGFKTTPWSGYLGDKLRGTCERPIGTALTRSPVLVLELIDGQTESSSAMARFAKVSCTRKSGRSNALCGPPTG